MVLPNGDRAGYTLQVALQQSMLRMRRDQCYGTRRSDRLQYFYDGTVTVPGKKQLIFQKYSRIKIPKSL